MSRRKIPKRRSPEDLAAQYRQEAELRTNIKALERKTRAFLFDAEFRRQCSALSQHLNGAEALIEGMTEAAGHLVVANIALGFQLRDLGGRLEELGAHRDAGTAVPAARIEADRVPIGTPHSAALQGVLDKNALSRQRQLYVATPSTAVEPVEAAAREVRQYLRVLMESIASIVSLSGRITQLSGGAVTGRAALVEAEERARSLEPALQRHVDYLEDLLRQHRSLAADRDHLLSVVCSAEGR